MNLTPDPVTGEYHVTTPEEAQWVHEANRHRKNLQETGQSVPVIDDWQTCPTVRCGVSRAMLAVRMQPCPTCGGLGQIEKLEVRHD